MTTTPRPNWMEYQDEGGARPRPGRPIGDESTLSTPSAGDKAAATPKRLNYKKQTAILVEFIEHLVEIGQQVYGEANASGSTDAPCMAAWRDEVGLVHQGVLSRPDLQELVTEFKRKRQEARDVK